MRRWKAMLAMAVLAGMLGACAGNQVEVNDSSDNSSAGGSVTQIDNEPVGTITKVTHVKVTPAQNDEVQFRGSSSASFSYDDLQAVLYCRAWRHAQSKGFAGGYPLRFHKLEGANAASAHVAIASIQMFQGNNSSGKSSLNQVWCSKVPSAAK